MYGTFANIILHILISSFLALSVPSFVNRPSIILIAFPVKV